MSVQQRRGLVETLTRRWEVKVENRLMERDDLARWFRENPGISQVLVAVFSIGLNQHGRPTKGNEMVVRRAVHIHWLCELIGIPCTLMFITGENQPVGISSAEAMKKFAIECRPGCAKDIRLGEKSHDTPGNAKEVAMAVQNMPRGTKAGIVLVCHPIHMRRSWLCLKYALYKIQDLLNTWNMVYHLIVAPADYAMVEYPRWSCKMIRCYETTPGQPWLNHHTTYLLYEMLAYVYCWLLPGRSK